MAQSLLPADIYPNCARQLGEPFRGDSKRCIGRTGRGHNLFEPPQRNIAVDRKRREQPKRSLGSVKRLNAHYVTDLPTEAPPVKVANGFPHSSATLWCFELLTLLSQPRASIRQSWINPECDFSNVLDRLIRRKHLHEWPSPHVPIESCERVRAQIACTARGGRTASLGELHELMKDFQCTKWFVNRKAIEIVDRALYRNKPVATRQIGRELTVRYVLEGSAQRSVDRVRVTAQLISADTDAQIWAERFDRDIVTCSRYKTRSRGGWRTCSASN
jgi:hypothetical protein